MPLSTYEIVIPPMVHGLGVMEDYVGQAERLAEAKSVPLDEILDARLVPDMLSFEEQIQAVCNKVEAHVAKLTRTERPAVAKVKSTAAALRERISDTVRYLNGISEGQLAGAETHTYELTPPIVRGWFGGTDYITLLVMPDFNFHVATAHDILRHLGAPIGKRDYLGRLSQESGGAYS
jgi:uncharacterized protein